jgi:hypothetical protein
MNHHDPIQPELDPRRSASDVITAANQTAGKLVVSNLVKLKPQRTNGRI